MKRELEKESWKSFGRQGKLMATAAALAVLICLAAGVRSTVIASGDFMHPMMQPEKFTEHAVCENCGMNRNMWARTRHEFKNSTGSHYTCSLHCLADISAKAAAEPTEVKVALYTDPAREVKSEEAVYVVGSSAPGTMTMNSKLAFGSEQEAKAFAAANGGEVKSFTEAFAVATSELPMARKSIAEKRMKTGKTVLPASEDHCQVCGMMPVKFPDFRSQILSMDKKTIHFCSTSCLVKFNADPAKYMDPPAKAMMTFVTVYPEQVYDYAGGLYYVVGSSVMGSMGPEALPFREKSAAEAFAKENGGQVLTFGELTPEKIGGMKMM